MVVNHQHLPFSMQLLESFENQLSSMKMDLANKDRMLTMYESSMADLSSKVHSLRKTLEQKDREIRHLTDEKTTWFDLEGRSLASRAASEAGVLSDGCLSDSAMEQNGKAGKKKKKPWKVGVPPSVSSLTSISSSLFISLSLSLSLSLSPTEIFV